MPNDWNTNTCASSDKSRPFHWSDLIRTKQSSLVLFLQENAESEDLTSDLLLPSMWTLDVSSSRVWKGEGLGSVDSVRSVYFTSWWKRQSFLHRVPVISATWAKCVWGNSCVSWKWCRERNRWTKLISPCMFKWKGIYLREWPRAGIKRRRDGGKEGTEEYFLFRESRGKATFSQARTDRVATQSGFREL